MWFLYLVLKSFSVSPMYVSVVLLSLRVTVAWKITNDYRQFLSSGHVFFCRQLHVLLLSMVACLLATIETKLSYAITNLSISLEKH